MMRGECPTITAGPHPLWLFFALYLSVSPGRRYHFSSLSFVFVISLLAESERKGKDKKEAEEGEKPERERRKTRKEGTCERD